MEEVKTEITKLPSSRVKLQVEVSPEQLKARLDSSARAMAKDIKLPGFRKGKVPPQLLAKRLGREEVLQQTLQDSLAEWYRAAVISADVSPIGDPDIDLDDLPAEGEPLSFTVEVGVRPQAKLGTYKGLEAGKREVEISGEQIEPELEHIRDSMARLNPVDRALRLGDFAILDFVGATDGTKFEGGEARDYSIELGSQQLVGDFEQQLVGLKKGDTKSVGITFPQDYQAENLAGKDAVFEVTVKAVQEKQLPEIDDDLAQQASEFETLDELKQDIEQKLRAVQLKGIEEEFREAVLDAVVKQAQVEVPPELAQARASELWQSLAHRLSHQGIAAETYLRMTGKTEEDLLKEFEPQAEQSLKRESVLTELIEAEQIEASDEELLELLAESAQQEGTTPGGLLERLKQAGRERSLRRDVCARKAVDLIVEHAKPISVEQAAAREKLWTPEDKQSSQPQQDKELWTPEEA